MAGGFGGSSTPFQQQEEEAIAYVAAWNEHDCKGYPVPLNSTDLSPQARQITIDLLRPNPLSPFTVVLIPLSVKAKSVMFRAFKEMMGYKFGGPPYTAQNIDTCNTFTTMDLGPNPKMVFKLGKGSPMVTVNGATYGFMNVPKKTETQPVDVA